jgi:hypothetical protein
MFFVSQESEQDKITYLLNVIGTSDLVFIRNGSEYSGGETNEHLQQKMDSAGIFIHTAEDFIHYIASGSSINGTPTMYAFPMAHSLNLEYGFGTN